MALLSLAVVGTLIQVAGLDKKDTTLTETTFLVDSLLEKRVSAAREYDDFKSLCSTPPGDFLTLETGRDDGLDRRFLYRVDVDEQLPGLKKVVVSVYYRQENTGTPVVNTLKGQDGRAVSASSRALAA